MTITLLGAGNVATSLAPALIRAGHRLHEIYSRRLSSAQQLSASLPTAVPCTDSLEHLMPSDCYIYSLTDNALPKVIAMLSEHADTHLRQALHLHTAGSVPLSVFPDSWEHTGILYPFNSFSKQEVLPFEKVPLLIESNDAVTLGRIRTLAESLTPMVYDADSAQRGHVHLAGNLVNCFGNCLAKMAQEQLDTAGIPSDILVPLMQQTVDKLRRLSPAEAQTGPARRRDTDTLSKHLALLESEQDRQIYRLLTEKIMSYC